MEIIAFERTTLTKIFFFSFCDFHFIFRIQIHIINIHTNTFSPTLDVTHSTTQAHWTCVMYNPCKCGTICGSKYSQVLINK